MTPRPLNELRAKVEELSALQAAATPGPWKVYCPALQINGGSQLLGGNPSVVHWTGFEGSDLPKKKRKSNAAFIASAHRLANLNRELLAALEAERGIADDARYARSLADAKTEHWRGQYEFLRSEFTARLSEAIGDAVRDRPAALLVPTDTAIIAAKEKGNA